MRQKNFEKKNVYIVGGSEGIGLEAAKLFAGSGANVIIFSRSKQKLEQAVSEIKQHRSSDTQEFSYSQLDITDNQQVVTVMENAGKEFGPVDILINSAGRAIPDYVENIDYSQFDQIMKVNLYGIRNTVAALLPRLKEKGGTVVNVSSLLGLMGIFGYSDYAAAKFGVIGYSEALRSEMKGSGVHVSVLCPPDTDTPGYIEENKTKPAETRYISDKAKIRPPQYVAKALLKGIKKNKFLIIPGIDGKFVYCLKRWAPRLFSLAIDSNVKKSQKSTQKVHI
ncbi:MAG: SDR family oxidoreductase [bacterium]|nr:SDR family oxidoreductase [bacterium]